MAEYEYTCEYVPGDSKTLDVPDCLSRLITRGSPPDENELHRLMGENGGNRVEVSLGPQTIGYLYEAVGYALRHLEPQPASTEAAASPSKEEREGGGNRAYSLSSLRFLGIVPCCLSFGGTLDRSKFQKHFFRGNWGSPRLLPASSFSPRVGHRWLAWDDTTGVLLFRDGANSTAAHSRQAHRRETREHTSKTAGRAEE
jgi:hypothetical protein